MTRSSREATKIQLGRLTVGTFLGSGGFGVVHEASLEGIEHTFAVKFLEPSPWNEDLDSATRRFFREAQVLFKLRHPNVTPIYGVGEHEGRPFILMERFGGLDLVAARSKGPPPPDAVLGFIERVASALSYAHQNGVVHRDIKPRNLMTMRGDARVLDFGVAALLDPGGERLTRTSAAGPGDAFCAPELNEDPSLVDARCDLYSLGASWYWLLTGSVPKGISIEARLRAGAPMSSAYERVLLRCLEQADRRYSTAEELLADVKALRAGDVPSHAPHEVSDDQGRVLGAIVGACPASSQTVNLFSIEREVASRTTRLRTSLALRSLLKREMIEEVLDSNFAGEPEMTYRPTHSGAEWAQQHIHRIEELLAPVPSPEGSPADDDEIPF